MGTKKKHTQDGKRLQGVVALPWNYNTMIPFY
jgi:hypothetical protein